MNWISKSPKQNEIEQGRVIAAIKLYQSKHNGMSPPTHVIAKETELAPGQVAYHIRKLEDQGKLFVANKWPMQIIFPKGEEAPDETPRAKNEVRVEVEEPKAAKENSGIVKLGFPERAKQFAEVIVTLTKRNKRPPSVSEIAVEAMGKSTGQASRIVQGMINKGWATHKAGHRHDVRLTELGREKLLGDQPLPRSNPSTNPRWDGVPPEERSQQMRDLVRKRWEKEGKAGYVAKPDLPNRNRRKTFFERAKEIAQAIHAKDGPVYVQEISLAVYGRAKGGTVPKLIQRMAEEGWVTHKPRHHGDIRLTDKGRSVLLSIEEPVELPVQDRQELTDEAREEVTAATDAIMPELSGEYLNPGDAYEDAPEPTDDKPREAKVIEVPAETFRLLLAAFTDLDLVLELSARGYRVTR